MTDDANDAAEQIRCQMVEYQNVMAQSIKQYEDMVAKAQADLAKIVAAASPTQPPPQMKPEAQWTEANGNELLVLNKAAAEFFSAIFEQVGVVAQHLAEIANAKKR